MKAERVLLAFGLFMANPFAGDLRAGDGKSVGLTESDKKYLAGLLQEFLFDPKGAERVAVKVTVRSVWASSGETVTEGWLVAAKLHKTARVYFTDGGSIVAPAEKDMKKIDFLAHCKKRYVDKPDKADDAKKGDSDEVFRAMQRTAVGDVGNHDLALAAWLHRLGHDDLAAKALAAARKGADEIVAQIGGDADARQLLRSELAWSAFAGMVHAYMVRADEEAFMHGERYLKLYAKDDKEKKFTQAAAVVDELKRRQKKGTFGKTPAEKWPDGFDKWEVKKKVAFLIDALEEVDARQWGQPGGVDLASDRRVEELMRIGDAAVPALIDALEKDQRLTRSVHFWRDFARSRTVLSVREAALTALMSILRVRVFEPVSTGDNFTDRGEEEVIQTTKRLRAYWNEYGKFPFDTRMMKVLTDPKANFEAKQEAARNLASILRDRRLRTTIHPTIIGEKPPAQVNPVIAKFSKPTVAEAILAALDANLKDHDTKKKAESDDYYRRQIEGAYISALAELKDKRIAPELAARAAKADTLRSRRQWSHLAHFLGEPMPFALLADDFRLGNLRFAAGEEGERELSGVVAALINVATPEAERALTALVDRKHPQYEVVARKVLKERVSAFDSGPWLAHPFCLGILRKALDDMTPTGATHLIERDRLIRMEENGEGSEPIPDLLRDPAQRRAKAEERAADVAALQLSELVIGMPRYHPLLKDADRRLDAMKALLDRFAGTIRNANRRERHILDVSSWKPAFLPRLGGLERPATADDVKTGKAIFHLAGKGKLAELKLPARGKLNVAAKDKDGAHVLIVQAEVDAEGSIVYGVITRHEIRAMPAPDVVSVKSFAELEREEKEAAKEKQKK